MKEQLIILLLFLFTSRFSWSQDRYIKTSTPCNIELLKKTPGRWMPVRKGFRAKISKQQEQEIVNRLNIFHQLTYNIYPTPKAFDATPFFATGDIAFASQLKIERAEDAYSTPPTGGTPTIFYEYVAQFCNYFCGRDKYEIIRGAGCEGGTCIFVTANNLDPIFNPLHLDDFYAEIMRIDDRPIKMMVSVNEEKWKGYSVYSGEGGKNMVLLHREGVLPYINVTRNQYLDRSIQCVEKSFDKFIKAAENPEGLNLLMDKKEREEQIKKLKKKREEALIFYNNELVATTTAGLLETPAIVPGGMTFIDISIPIFTTQDEGGKMLVTENPAYLRKDLPKYIPQLIIYIMVYSDDWPGPAMNPYRLYEQDFPIEKLQAMIDK